MNVEAQRTRTRRALNVLCKWRTILVGWQLGTRSADDPEAAALRDHRDLTLLLRAEVSAVVALLREKGLITEAEWLVHLEREAEHLSKAFEARFPGVTAHEHGLTMDPVKVQAAGWMKGWKP